LFSFRKEKTRNFSFDRTASMRFVVAILLLALAAPALGVSWTNCASSSIMDVTSVSVNPDPVKRSQPATFSITGDHEQDIVDGAVLEVSVQAFGMQVHSESGPLCLQQSCPLSAGTSTLAFTNDMPSFLPSSTYTTFEGKTSDGDIIFCVKVKL
jgi:hypothetical protein